MGKRVAVPMRLRENECQPAELVERQFTTEQRDEMAKSGHAMADGSFPIETVQDLENAVQAFGRAKHPDMAKAHIVKRARALKALDRLPEEWNVTEAGKPVEVAQIPAGQVVRESVSAGQVIEAVKDSQGRAWEVLLIASGLSANGNYYPSETLEKAAPLFEGTFAYADHPTADDRKQRPERSIRDKVGKFVDAKFGRWVIGGKVVEGVKATFKVFAPWLREVLVEAYDAGEPDFLGFSIDASGNVAKRQHNGKLVNWVEEITAVHSTDVVTTPAAGGRVVRLVASGPASHTAEEEGMDPEKIKELIAEAIKTGNTELAATLREALTASLTEQAKRTSELETRLAALTEVQRVSSVRAKIDAALGAITLSEVGKTRLRKEFYDCATRRDVTDDELTVSLKEAQDYEAALVQQAVRPGSVARARFGPTAQDKMIHALDGFFDGRNVENVPRFVSIKEAYCRWTGRDYLDVTPSEWLSVFRTRYESTKDSTRVKEALTTSDWSDVFADTLYRKMIREYQADDYQRWRKLVSDIDSVSDFRTKHYVRIGGYADLSSVTEQGTYPTLTTPGDEEVEAAVSKYGGIDSITWESIMNDDVGSIRRIPKELGQSASRTLFKDILDLITTDNPTMDYDSTALYTSHSNSGTNALALGGVNTSIVAMRDQTRYGASADTLGPRNYPRFIVVPNELEQRAQRIFNPSPQYQAMILDSDAASANDGTGIDPRAFADKGIEVFVYDYLTDANDWFLVADPNKVPTVVVQFLAGREEPELFVQDQPQVGSVFTADKVSYKIRHIWGRDVLEHRSFYRNVVT